MASDPPPLAPPGASRRTLLGLLAGGAAGSAAALTAGCGSRGSRAPVARPSARPHPAGVRRVAYGRDPAQYAELHHPAGTPRGVVVVVHGGFWSAEYAADLGRPLAADLARQGWLAWNIEYRRVGDGGGFPTTLDDVHRALGHLRRTAQTRALLGRRPLVVLGHSSGGQLAAWSAARGRFARWRGGPTPTHVVTQAGVLDLVAGAREGLGGGAAERFMGGPPSARWRRADPAQQVPLPVPVWCVHATDDDVVPLTQSSMYVDRARAAGADAALVTGSGGHFAHLDTGSALWHRTRTLVDRIGA